MAKCGVVWLLSVVVFLCITSTHVKFLVLQIVNLGDLKPEPVLWHEDSGRKPWENGRYALIVNHFH